MRSLLFVLQSFFGKSLSWKIEVDSYIFNFMLKVSFCNLDKVDLYLHKNSLLDLNIFLFVYFIHLINLTRQKNV